MCRRSVAPPGFRNSQTTVLAPTGTIAFMMDCDTTGVEPDIALVKYKKLVGGGMLKIVNQTVPRALKRLGYETKQVQAILEYIEEHDTIEGAPELKPEHLPIFDCAFKAARGTRAIHSLGHLRMMGAVQPFISGAISKTINMPSSASIDDIMEAYVEAWRLGVKAVAVYRDGCKRTQPLNTAREKKPATLEFRPVRQQMPQDCRSLRHKFDIAGHEGYIHVGLYEDGAPGELLIKITKEGSTISGLIRYDRHSRIDGPAVWCSPRSPGQQIQSRALRAVRVHQEPGDSDCEVTDRLHLPLSGHPLPATGATGADGVGRHGARGGRTGAAADGSSGNHALTGSYGAGL